MRLTPMRPAHSAVSRVAGAPPDARAQPGGVRLDALQPGAAAERAVRVALGDPLALDRAQERREVLARDVGAARVLRAGVAERLVAAHDRLG